MILLFGLAAASSGCPGGPASVPLPKVDADAAGLKAIELFDTDQDGVLSGKELDKCPGLKAACIPLGSAPSTVDPARTGRITAAMITARIKQWQAMKVSRLMVSCKLTHNGRPLEGAHVRFVPEPFLGPDMPTVTGVTDKTGAATLSVRLAGKDDRPGVPPGFYRVEISKPGKPSKPAENGQPAEPAQPGLDIPAKYNTETILGQEVARDAARIRNIKFDLVF
jgi:hypothetical protein